MSLRRRVKGQVLERPSSDTQPVRPWMLGSPATLRSPASLRTSPGFLPGRSTQSVSPHRETVLEGTSSTCPVHA